MCIYIWGTGLAAKYVLENYISIDRVAGFIDNDEYKKRFMNKNVFTPDFLIDNDYECVIIATSHTQEVYLQCIEMKIDLSKCIFIFNNYVIDDMNKDYCFIEKMLGSDEAKRIKNEFEIVKGNHHIISNSYQYNDYFSNNLFLLKSDVNHFETDYVRIKIFEMILHELNDVEGEAAELGVFRGDFAQYINYAFPDKKLYLFDSFEGFDENEAQKELNNKNCNDSFIETFKRTSIDLVLKKMIYPEKVIIKKGFFPHSLDGLEEKFAFVSLDVDFEDTTLEGLRYFYPRLSSGGYIFVHDYNNKDVLLFKDLDIRTGIQNAVKRYEKEIGQRLHKVPICDAFGTLIISK